VTECLLNLSKRNAPGSYFVQVSCDFAYAVFDRALLQCGFRMAVTIKQQESQSLRGAV
jgi:hypothetical protein